MFRREVISHLIVTFIYFAIVSLFNFRLGFGLLFLWLGALLGTFLLSLDWQQFEYFRQTFRSALFQPILLVLTFFVLTSTASLFGTGVVMAMNLHLLKDEWQCFLEKGDFGWLFWQIKRKIDQKGQRIYLATVTFFFVLLTLFLL